MTSVSVIIAPWRKSSNPLLEACFALVADKSSTWYKTRRKVIELVHRSHHFTCLLIGRERVALYQRWCCCHFSLYFTLSSHIQPHSHLAFPFEFDGSNFIRVSFNRKIKDEILLYWNLSPKEGRERREIMVWLLGGGTTPPLVRTVSSKDWYAYH